MSRKYKAGLILVITGICVLIISAFLTLAVDQARILVSLYAASAAPSSAGGAGNLLRPDMLFGDDALILFSVAAVLFLLVFRRPRRLLPVLIVAALVFVGLNLYSGRHILPQLLIQPSPVALSERYVQALAANDLDAALLLTDGSDACDETMAQVFQDHRALLKQSVGDPLPESSIRDISIASITTFYDKPLPEGFVTMQPVPKQLAIIRAKAESDRTIWLNLKMGYRPFLGTRYICGKDIDSGWEK